MALDMDRYRDLFLEEAGEHLAEISRALLGLEKDQASVECIDTIFRMAHSIKSMAATLSYDSISELAHALEDHMEGIRSAKRVDGPEALALLFRGLEGLEQMVGVVGETGESPEPLTELKQALSAKHAPAPPAVVFEPGAPDDPPAQSQPERGPEKKA